MDDWESAVIQREKEKILKEHLPNLDGFLSKNLVKMGENFGVTKVSERNSRIGYSENYKM